MVALRPLDTNIMKLGMASILRAVVDISSSRVRNVVDATRFGVHDCEPGRVSDGSRLALCQTLSIECPSSIFLWPVYFVIPVPFSLSFFVCLCFSFALIGAW